MDGHSMKRPTSVTALLKDLESNSELRNTPVTQSALRQVLAAKNGELVARGAHLAAKVGIAELEQELCAAFAHFLEDGADSDKRCVAKRAIVKALADLKLNARDLFLKGMRFYWPETPYTGQSDEAAGLRIICIETLALFGHPNLLFDLLDRLFDPTPDVRAATVRTLGSTAERAAALLLRFKALTGDREVSVMDACFSALIAVDKEGSIPFVADFLSSGAERVRTAAALALGESESDLALDCLVEARRHAYDHDFRMDLNVAIALLRRPRAIDYLVSLVESGGKDAEDAVKALAIFRSNRSLVDRIETSVEKLNQQSVTSIFAEKFRSD
jgi:HEAT repeat protein